MLIGSYTRLLGKVMVMLFAMALLCVFSVGSPMASAHTLQRAAPVAHMSAPHGKVHPTSFTPCRRIHNGNFDEFCFTPTVTTSCPGTQYWQVTDSNGQPVDWTKTDQYNTCVHVSYNYTFTRSSCDVYFYPSNGYGDATFSYSLTGGATIHMNPINEAPYSDYIDIFSPTSSGTMSFTDHDYPGNLALGWGYGSTDGLEEFCS